MAHISLFCSPFLGLQTGLSGLLPIAPVTYMKAWRNRKRDADKAAQEAEAAAAKESAS